MEKIETKRVFSIGNRDKDGRRMMAIVQIFTKALIYDAEL